MRLRLGLLVLLTACEGEDIEERVQRVVALDGDPVAGEALWAQHCVRCHSSPSSFASIPEAGQIRIMLQGPPSMPTFGQLADQELADIAAFVIAQ